MSVTDSTPNDIAGKDWAYDLGNGSRVGAISKMDLDSSLLGLSSVLSIKKDSYKELSESELLDIFHQELGVKNNETYIDATGDPMIINDELFKTMGWSKIKKRDRHLFIEKIAKTIKEPHEIYLEYDSKNKRLLKKMFRYLNDNGKKRAVVVMFEYLKDKTQGVSAYFIDTESSVEKKRIEKLIYVQETTDKP